MLPHYPFIDALWSKIIKKRSQTKVSNTHNYADDNTLSAHGDTVIEVTKSLEKGAEEALSWFLSNGMSANADKFQAIFSRKDKQSTAGISLKIGSEKIE